ncbi:MAG TPA: helix-turn-helix domain-containing protein [Pseudoflavonifractor sp.]|nr:helix-turn-helix domain-containing protein [Pseudoflavonifractor sp.]
MSNFSHNLPILRRGAGYTQETLAEALNVSRQAISKWESGQTLPEAATLLTLADLLRCTLDQLMREELADDGGETAATRQDQDEEERYALFVDYDSHMDRFARMMAGGVALVLLGVAALMASYAVWGESGFIALPLLLCVAAAVFLFISGGIAHGDFQKAHPVLPDFYAPQAIADFQRVFRMGIAAAVSAIVADVALLVALCVIFEQDGVVTALSVALFFLVLSAAVGALVFLGIQQSKYDVSQYAQEAMQSSPNSPESRLNGSIMMLATAIFLLAGFLFHAWHPAWVVFPVGGLLCGIVGNIQKK